MLVVHRDASKNIRHNPRLGRKLGYKLHGSGAVSCVTALREV